MPGPNTTMPISNQANSTGGAFDPWAGYKDKSKEANKARMELATRNSALQQQMANTSDFRQRMALQQQIDANAAADWRLQNEEKGLDVNGTPIAPEWRSLIDPATGQLRDQYRANISNLDPSSWQGYQQLKGEALRGAGNQSEWAKLQTQKQAGEEAQAKQNAAQQAFSSQSQALGQLGMRGGYGSGARTLSALGLQRGLIGANQGVGLQGMQNRLGIATTDEAQRQSGLQGLATSEADIGKYNKGLEAKQTEYNLNNLMQEIQGRRGAEQNTYNEQMKKWAAERQAQATQASGGGGK